LHVLGHLLDVGEVSQRVHEASGVLSVSTRSCASSRGSLSSNLLLEPSQYDKGIGDLEPRFSHLDIKLNSMLLVLLFLQFFYSLLSFNKSRALFDDLIVDEKGFFGLLTLLIENSKVVPDLWDV